VPIIRNERWRLYSRNRSFRINNDRTGAALDLLHILPAGLRETGRKAAKPACADRPCPPFVVSFPYPRLIAKMCMAVPLSTLLLTSGNVTEATVFDESTGTVVAYTYMPIDCGVPPWSLR
jgi:hypothetical protein